MNTNAQIKSQAKAQREVTLWWFDHMGKVSKPTSRTEENHTNSQDTKSQHESEYNRLQKSQKIKYPGA